MIHLMAYSAQEWFKLYQLVVLHIAVPKIHGQDQVLLEKGHATDDGLDHKDVLLLSTEALWREW